MKEALASTSRNGSIESPYSLWSDLTKSDDILHVDDGDYFYSGSRTLYKAESVTRRVLSSKYVKRSKTTITKYEVTIVAQKCHANGASKHFMGMTLYASPFVFTYQRRR